MPTIRSDIRPSTTIISTQVSLIRAQAGAIRLISTTAQIAAEAAPPEAITGIVISVPTIPKAVGPIDVQVVASLQVGQVAPTAIEIPQRHLLPERLRFAATNATWSRPTPGRVVPNLQSHLVTRRLPPARPRRRRIAHPHGLTLRPPRRPRPRLTLPHRPRLTRPHRPPKEHHLHRATIRPALLPVEISTKTNRRLS